jgi:AAA15 family ATPase/GTPase
MWTLRAKGKMMRIKTIELKKFKRFTNLKIEDIPQSAKLIVLVGPNGSGKTSLFEAFNHWYKLIGYSNPGNQEYIEKKQEGSYSTGNWYQDKVKIQFHDLPSQEKSRVRGKFYFRTAYRNEPEFIVQQLNKQNDPIQSFKLENLMLNDQTVSENYQRLVAQTLAGVYKAENDAKSVHELREEIIGKIKNTLACIFDDLNLSSIGDPLTNGSFYFIKGESRDFNYKNLSAGEKSVFDLILDLIIKSSYYNEAIYCIDEPEAHMHTRLQSKLLRELFTLTPSNSQLWISTHSIGMLKEAENIEKTNPGTVVFLDFDNRDFDSDEIITPSKISKAIWDKFYDLSFGDFSKLMAPRNIVFCEGTPKGRKYKNFDAQIYTVIFEQKYHDTKFISLGSCSELENLESITVGIVGSILNASQIIKIVDRDDRSGAEIDELKRKGIKTTTRRHIESYLLDDSVIHRLCEKVQQLDKYEDCIAAKERLLKESMLRGNPSDDIKSASGDIFNELKRILKLTQCGNNTCSFLRDSLAPLITEDMPIYQEIEREIFT